MIHRLANGFAAGHIPQPRRLVYDGHNALTIGITPEELYEALLQAGVYHGGSGYRNAANVMRDVFLQRGVVAPVE